MFVGYDSYAYVSYVPLIAVPTHAGIPIIAQA